MHSPSKHHHVRSVVPGMTFWTDSEDGDDDDMDEDMDVDEE